MRSIYNRKYLVLISLVLLIAFSLSFASNAKAMMAGSRQDPVYGETGKDMCDDPDHCVSACYQDCDQPSPSHHEPASEEEKKEPDEVENDPTEDEDRGEVHATPDHPLHNTKKASESSNMNLVRDRVDKGRLNSVFAHERVREAKDMKKKGKDKYAKQPAGSYEKRMNMFKALSKESKGRNTDKINNLAQDTATQNMFATESALPTNGSLYSIKKVSENSALDFSQSDATKSKFLGLKSTGRLFETKKLKGMGKIDMVKSTGKQYNNTMERFEHLSKSSGSSNVEKIFSNTFSQQNNFLKNTTPTDNLLYGLKKKSEKSVLGGIKSNKSLKAGVLSKISDTRLQESKILAEMGKFDLANKSLKGYQSKIGSLRSLGEEVSGEQKTNIEKILAKTSQKGMQNLSAIQNMFPSGKKDFVKGILNQTSIEHSFAVGNLEEKLGSLPKGITSNTSSLMPSDLLGEEDIGKNLENLTEGLENLEDLQNLNY